MKIVNISVYGKRRYLCKLHSNCSFLAEKRSCGSSVCLSSSSTVNKTKWCSLQYIVIHLEFVFHSCLAEKWKEKCDFFHVLTGFIAYLTDWNITNFQYSLIIRHISYIYRNDTEFWITSSWLSVWIVFISIIWIVSLSI